MDSPAHWPGASRPLPLPVGRGGRQRTRAPWRHATSLPACVPRHRDASGLLFGAASNPWTPSLIPFSCPPSRSAPRTRAESPPPTPIAAATVLPTPHRHPRELRLDPLLPPHRPTALRKPCNAATIAVSIAGRRGSSPSIRPLRRAPEPTNPPYSSAVSLRAEPLSLPSRLRALGHSSAAAELRPPLTSSPPSLQPLELVSERVTALRKPPGA